MTVVACLSIYQFIPQWHIKLIKQLALDHCSQDLKAALCGKGEGRVGANESPPTQAYIRRHSHHVSLVSCPLTVNHKVASMDISFAV